MIAEDRKGIDMAARDKHMQILTEGLLETFGSGLANTIAKTASSAKTCAISHRLVI
jgi:hypothetical protein